MKIKDKNSLLAHLIHSNFLCETQFSGSWPDKNPNPVLHQTVVDLLGTLGLISLLCVSLSVAKREESGRESFINKDQRL